MPLPAPAPVPLPRNTIRVGVTGHRRLDPAHRPGVRAGVRLALSVVREAAHRPDPGPGLDPAHPPRQVLVSPLAEGADQLAAEEALALGYELQAAFPFAAETYAEDFAPGSAARTAFHALCARATSVFELDGARDSALATTQAYAAVGRLVLAQSDVLLAIWDGEPARGDGGTAQMVREALQARIPVIVVRPGEGTADAPRLMVCQDSSTACAADPQALREQVRSLLFATPPEDGLAHFEAYLAESAPAPALPDDAPLAEADPSHPRAVTRLREGFRRHYARADGLAMRYARRYRRGFRANYLLGALAVLLALLAHAVEDAGPGGATLLAGGPPLTTVARALVGLEALCLLAILGIFAWGHRGQWLRRAVEYRTLAEHFRQMRHLLPLGLAVPFSRPPAHLREHADLRLTWMNMHFRAVLRDLGLPHARATPAYLASVRAMLSRDWIAPQRAFHAARVHQLTHKLHRGEVLALGFFLVALVAAVLHLLHLEAIPPSLLLGLAAGAPAWGAALHGIQSQGEYRRLTQRYASMQRRLEELTARLADAPAALAPLQDLAHTAAAEMIEEVNDWQVLYRAHVIPTP